MGGVLAARLLARLFTRKCATGLTNVVMTMSVCVSSHSLSHHAGLVQRGLREGSVADANQPSSSEDRAAQRHKLAAFHTCFHSRSLSCCCRDCVPFFVSSLLLSQNPEHLLPVVQFPCVGFLLRQLWWQTHPCFHFIRSFDHFTGLLRQRKRQ
jgi:hypothetical protein